MWDLFLPVETFGPEAISHRQRLAQAVCLQLSTTSLLWKVLVRGILTHSYTDVGPIYS